MNMIGGLFVDDPKIDVLPKQEYIDLVKQAGFQNVNSRRSTSAGTSEGVPIYSIQVSAKR